jgi:hypothetical protein
MELWGYQLEVIFPQPIWLLAAILVIIGTLFVLFGNLAQQRRSRSFAVVSFLLGVPTMALAALIIVGTIASAFVADGSVILVNVISCVVAVLLLRWLHLAIRRVLVR